jgi:predicted  nucleic acid-binding Zn-ribbon protein
VRSLENLKNQREKVNKDIFSMEQYKEKLKNQIQNFQKELEVTESMNYLIILDEIQDKTTVFEVYEKLLRDSDNAYSKVKFNLKLDC